MELMVRWVRDMFRQRDERMVDFAQVVGTRMRKLEARVAELERKAGDE